MKFFVCSPLFLLMLLATALTAAGGSAVLQLEIFPQLKLVLLVAVCWLRAYCCRCFSGIVIHPYDQSLLCFFCALKCMTRQACKLKCTLTDIYVCEKKKVVWLQFPFWKNPYISFSIYVTRWDAYNLWCIFFSMKKENDVFCKGIPMAHGQWNCMREFNVDDNEFVESYRRS